MPTGLVYDDAFLLHQAPYPHLEHPGRLSSIKERLDREGLTARCAAAPAREATDEELLAIHTADHIRTIDGTASRHFVQLDLDTYTSRESAHAARLAAGGLVDLVAKVVGGELRNGFALLRPPGHHAEADRAMGFCLFNNIAVAAQAARKLRAQRILIVDWDLHHGNGTQHSFYDEAGVLYFSAHQFPFYPGTGDLGEVGQGKGRGFTVNVPWPGGMGDAEYVGAFERVLLPMARQFEPDLVLVSCGFDAAEGDLLGSMRVSAAGYAQMTARLLSLAEGKVVLALEGGYNLDAISAAAAASTRALLGEPPPALDPTKPSPIAERILDRVVKIQREFWSGI